MDFTNKLVGGYRLLEHIGSGAYGKVYKAQHPVLPRIAAVKLLTTGSDSQEKREKFLQEAKYLETLRHKYILEVIDANIEEDGTPFIISRFATGGSLAERLRQVGGRLSAEMTLRILNQIGEALEHAHLQKVIHRDLKPGNILFDEAGNAVLSDFGIATSLADDHSLRHTTHVLGTPYYMAPEQISKVICREIDQYALGCVAYEMFTGRKVFDGQSHLEIYIKHTNEAPDPPSRYNSCLPEHIERAILRALAKRREDRHPSVAAFLHALNNQTYALDDAPPTLDTLSFSSGNSPATSHKGSAPLFTPQKSPPTPMPMEPGPRSQPPVAAAPAKKKPEPVAPAQEVRRKAENSNAYIQRGRKDYNEQRYQEALEAFQKGVELVPRNASYQRFLGLAYQKVKQYPAALEALERATQLEPVQAGHFFALGELHNEMQNHEQAMIAFAEAVRLSPNNADYRKSLEKARAQSNQIQGKATPKLKKQPTQPPAQPAQTPAQAQARPKEQPVAQAQSTQMRSRPIQQAQTTKQPHPATLAQPKAQEARTPSTASAKESQNAASSLPDNAEKCFEQGMALYGKEDYNRALVAFDRAVQLAPQNPTYLCAQGRAYLALSRYDDALATFNGSINAKPRHHEGHYWKAETLKAMGKLKEAEKVMTTARSLSNPPKQSSTPKQMSPARPATPNKHASQQNSPNRPSSVSQPYNVNKPENQEGLLQRIIKKLFP